MDEETPLGQDSTSAQALKDSGAPLRARREDTPEDEEEELEEKKGRVKKIVLILIILMLILLGLLYLAGLDRGEDPLPEPVSPISFTGPWNPVTTFSGESNRTIATRKFTVTSSQWRVIWSARPKIAGDDGLDNSLVFFLVPNKLKEPPHENVLIVGTTIEPRTATWNFRTKPGTYYFKVSSRNVKWRLRIEQMPVATPKPDAK